MPGTWRLSILVYASHADWALKGYSLKTAAYFPACGIIFGCGLLRGSCSFARQMESLKISIFYPRIFAYPNTYNSAMRRKHWVMGVFLFAAVIHFTEITLRLKANEIYREQILFTILVTSFVLNEYVCFEGSCKQWMTFISARNWLRPIFTHGNAAWLAQTYRSAYSQLGAVLKEIGDVPSCILQNYSLMNTTE